MKKRFKTAYVVLAIVLLVASCTKEGPVGPAGKDGVNGTNGADGNANVKVFLFTSGNTFSSGIYNKSYILPGVTNNMVDSSLVLVYFTDETDSWVPVGSTNTGRTYSTKWYYIKGFGGSQTGSFYIDLDSPAGGTEYTGSAVTLGKVKFILAPASGFSGKKEPVDFSNYQATMRYFNLPE